MIILIFVLCKVLSEVISVTILKQVQKFNFTKASPFFFYLNKKKFRFAHKTLHEH